MYMAVPLGRKRAKKSNPSLKPPVPERTWQAATLFSLTAFELGPYAREVAALRNFSLPWTG